MLDDGVGSLWLGSLGGIFRVSKAELRAIEERRQTAASWLQLDRSDGLLTRECTGGFQPAAWRAQDGELRFPTVNGVDRIRPEKLATNPVPPPVLIEEVRLNDRARIARDLHDDLGASLTEISMLAALAAEEHAPAEALREPLQQIAGKARTLVGALDEIVWAVNPRHASLASLADYLAAFATEFLASTGFALRLDVAHDLPPLPLNAERRHGLFLAVREALNNAVKHSGTREVWLRLRLDADCLLITIEDHGRGFDPAKKSGGDGLRNLCERLTDLGGECRIDSIDGAGTRVHFRLPLPPP